MTEENKYYTEEEMLNMLHTNIDGAIDVVAAASVDLITDMESGVDNLSKLKADEKGMYVICTTFLHMFNNYYRDESIIQMVNERLAKDKKESH